MMHSVPRFSKGQRKAFSCLALQSSWDGRLFDVVVVLTMAIKLSLEHYRSTVPAHRRHAFLCRLPHLRSLCLQPVRQVPHVGKGTRWACNNDDNDTTLPRNHSLLRAMSAASRRTARWRWRWPGRSVPWCNMSRPGRRRAPSRPSHPQALAAALRRGASADQRRAQLEWPAQT